MLKKSIAILISGNGSNMLSIIKSANKPNYPGAVKLVISNNVAAKGILIARNYGIEVAIVNNKNYINKQLFEEKIHKLLIEKKIDIVCLAGFMKKLTKWFVKRWDHKLLNIHPSLLPQYKGLETHRRVLEDGCDLHGCTVHFVDEKIDNGQIIAQAFVPVLKDDNEEKLRKKVLIQEHILYPKALEMVILNNY